MAENVSSERIALNMINCILGRMHLASRLDLLSGNQMQLVKEGVEIYRKFSWFKKVAVPFFPAGFAEVGDATGAFGLKTDNLAYVAVYGLGDNPEIAIPLPNGVKSAKFCYPADLPTDYKTENNILRVAFSGEYKARLFEIKFWMKGKTNYGL